MGADKHPRTVSLRHRKITRISLHTNGKDQQPIMFETTVFTDVTKWLQYNSLIYQISQMALAKESQNS